MIFFKNTLLTSKERLKQLWKIDVMWHYLEKTYFCFSIVFDLSCLELFCYRKILATWYKRKYLKKLFVAFLDAFNECQTIVKVTEYVIEKDYFYYRRRWKIVWKIVTTRYFFILHLQNLILNMSIMVDLELTFSLT